MIRYVKQSVYNITIENKDLNLHELNHNIQLFLSIGMQLRYNDQDFMTPRTYQLSGNKMESKFVLIAPGSNNPVKNWEVEKYLEVAIELDKLGHIVKFIGTKSDLKGIKIPESLRDKIEVYSNGLNLKDLFSLISKSDLVISNDSSASHIAEFFKVRYLVISWGVFKGRYFPYPDSLNTSRVIYSQQCLNCGDFCKDSRINAKCLRVISVNEVLKQVNILLN
jgi:ADP-heptose:LPS heptosyltransferase